MEYMVYVTPINMFVVGFCLFALGCLLDSSALIGLSIGLMFSAGLVYGTA